jgi:UDP-2,3-diacylglucosamine hydrolase
MTSIFISDLHLDEQRPDVADIFLNFLKNEARAAKELYILGDFFEAWIGDDDLSTFNQMIISALRKATEQGLPIYIMHGNRDFLLGKKFMQAAGCQLLPEEAVINLHGVPTLLMHGDSLCTLDVKYLKFRKKSRTWLYKKLVSFKSLESRRAIAEKMRAASREHTKMTSEYIMDVTQTEVERVMQKHNVQHLIHGHTHREAVHHFNLKDTPATRTVLGPWHVLGSALVCEANGKKELVVIK